MIKFIGEYTAKVDDKGRLVLPSAFKSRIAAGADGKSPNAMKLIVRKETYAECLAMYTYEEWARETEEIMGRLNSFNKEHDMFWREYMRRCTEVEPDGKLGRITIPKKMLDAIGIDKEVVFSGCDNKIELWAKERYESSSMTDEAFVALAQQILG